VNDIDFLPDRLRVNRRENKTRLLWFAGVACCVIALGIASSLQYATRRRLTADLALAGHAYYTAQIEIQQLARARAELDAVQDEAELLTYLRHPWPRTQIIAALLAPLPETVTLTELQIARETPVQTKLGRIQREVGPEGTGQQPDKRTPARRDLERLRQAVDELQTVVLLEGTTTDGAALHRYLSDLGQAPLFTSIELGLLEIGENAGLTRFKVRLNVRSGYGEQNVSQVAGRSASLRSPRNSLAGAGP
jgi:hypothetical protein